MRALLFLCGVQLLARACSAQLALRCAVKVIGTSSDETAQHIETLRPGQQMIVFTIPPVCGQHVGLRAVACDSSSEPPKLELHGRQLVLERRADATGLGELTITLYCSPPNKPADKPSFLGISADDIPGISSVVSAIPAAVRSAPTYLSPKSPAIPLALAPIVPPVETPAFPLNVEQFLAEAPVY